MVRTRSAFRYARDQITEWNGPPILGSDERLRSLSGAQRLFGDPVMVCDPDWGEGVRALHRQVRELSDADFNELGYVSNRLFGSHRLCVNIGGPEWFLDQIRRIETLARLKDGRVSRPQQRGSPVTGAEAGGSYSNPARYAGRVIDCDRCGGIGWIDRADGKVDRCDLGAQQRRAGP